MCWLQTNEAVLANLVQDGPTAIVVSVLADGQILDVNDSFLQLIGYSREEVIGQSQSHSVYRLIPSSKGNWPPYLWSGDRCASLEPQSVLTPTLNARESPQCQKSKSPAAPAC